MRYRCQVCKRMMKTSWSKKRDPKRCARCVRIMKEYKEGNLLKNQPQGSLLGIICLKHRYICQMGVKPCPECVRDQEAKNA